MRSFVFTIFVCSSFLIAEDINDPFEDLNRLSFEFNESLDANFLKPIAETYSKSPRLLKKGVTNFFNSLGDFE